MIYPPTFYAQIDELRNEFLHTNTGMTIPDFVSIVKFITEPVGGTVREKVYVDSSMYDGHSMELDIRVHSNYQGNIREHKILIHLGVPLRWFMGRPRPGQAFCNVRKFHRLKQRYGNLQRPDVWGKIREFI